MLRWHCRQVWQNCWQRKREKPAAIRNLLHHRECKVWILLSCCTVHGENCRKSGCYTWLLHRNSMVSGEATRAIQQFGPIPICSMLVISEAGTGADIGRETIFRSTSAENWKRVPVFSEVPIIRVQCGKYGFLYFRHMPHIRAPEQLFAWRKHCCFDCGRSDIYTHMKYWVHNVSLLNTEQLKIDKWYREEKRFCLTELCWNNGLFPGESYWI